MQSVTGLAAAPAARLGSPAQASDRGESWWPQSLANGAAGIALLHIERAHTGHGTWTTAHQWLAAATRDPVTANPSSSLYYGAPAVAFALQAAARPGCQPALNELDHHIAALVHRRVEQAHARIDRAEPPALGEYDLIYGLTGLGAYLLRRDPQAPALAEVLSYLVRLTEPLPGDGDTLPGWWTGNDPADQASERFSGGHANLGMAHGICGPLALLAQAMRHGVTADGQAQAVARICTWLDAWRQDNGTGPWWPQWITRQELHAQRSTQHGPLRPSWCYGTPGQARAQQLAALATGDTTRQRLAEHALSACLTDQRQLARIADQSLCHGWAGLLHTTWRAAADAATTALEDHLPNLHTQLVQHTAQRAAATPPRPGAADGLLEGAAGTALASHTAATGAAPASAWDSCLLIN